jgi:hypothetical protein
MIRLFLLLAFYTLGANHRSAAAMYLGISTKAAVVVGLDNPRNCSPGDTDFRYDIIIFIHGLYTEVTLTDHVHGLVYGYSIYLPASFLDNLKTCVHLYKIPFRLVKWMMR